MIERKSRLCKGVPGPSMSNGLFEVMSEISQVPTKHLAFVVVKNRNSLKLTKKKKKGFIVQLQMDYSYKAARD